MKNLKVNIKKLHKDALIPSYAHSTDCGLDLTAVSKTYDEYGNIVYGFGLAFEIPEGYAGFIFPRSSNHKSRLLLTNSVGIVDSGYRGEVTFKFKNLEDEWSEEYNIGDRIGQIIILPYPQVNFIETEELSETERGDGGYGSSGK
jgi:dUTP pyrophosphatase